MRRVFCLLFMFLFCLSANADIMLSDSPLHQDSVIAATEFGAVSAFFSPSDDYIYYIKSGSGGTDIVIFDASVSGYSTVKTFSPEADYLSISADYDGSIYLLRCDHDETAKSGIVCLKKEGNSYFPLEYLFSAASGEMIPVSLEFSPLTSMGAMRFFLNNQGEYVSFVSPLSVFWNALTGYDEFLYIIPGELTAYYQPMTEFFDAYGYQTQEAAEFLKKIESQQYLSPSDASLSPDGTMLLMLVPYNDEKIIYVMDLQTGCLEIIYLPEEFSGSISWTNDGNIQTVDENGYIMNAEWNGFSDNAWISDSFSDHTNDWNFVGDDNLSDWS
ncbi:MAG: hypothetical protein IIW08_04920 [Clostridia bacterium]|nr:hypothetical protein [Clostridia bacterium]